MTKLKAKRSDAKIKADYIINAEGEGCPFCDDEEVSVSGGDYDQEDGKTVTLEMSCAACEKSWVNVYKLSTILIKE